MNKYSFAINEFRLTHEEHFEYKRLINDILYEIYGLDICIDGVYYVAAQDFDNPGSYISALNKAVGNITLIKWLVKTFDIKSKNDLISKVQNSKYSLFKTGEIYFDAVYQIIKNTENKGIENEKKALEHIKSYLEIKNFDFNIRFTELCSRQDVIDGIDIIITIANKEWYVQVKPLVNYIEGEVYEIHSSGKIKKYNNIHYYIFLNDDKILFFRNKELKVENGIIYVAKNSLVY